MNTQQLLETMKLLAKSKKDSQCAYSHGGASYSYNELNELVRAELNALAPDYRAYRENKNTIFSLIEQTIDDVLPKEVMQQYGQFADIKVFGQGEKPVFKQRITNASKQRAKQFIGKVGLAGHYEVFRLDGRSYEVETNAMGGSCEIGLEEFLDGRFSFADMLDILMKGLDESIYVEIQKSLVRFYNNLQAHNKYATNGFDEDLMDKALATVAAYGQPTIYCTYEFAQTMVPSDARLSDQMKEDRWYNGFFGRYKGSNVIILPQSFTDETNATKVVDPSYAWIIPTGAEKPVKIAMEGQTLTRETENEDWSRTMHVYRKIGVTIVASNDIAVYRNEDLNVNA